MAHFVIAALPCSTKDLKRYIENAVEVDPERPVLVDKYLDRADELDVDALADKDGNVVICGIMQHIEQAGVHSGGGHLRLLKLLKHTGQAAHQAGWGTLSWCSCSVANCNGPAVHLNV